MYTVKRHGKYLTVESYKYEWHSDDMSDEKLEVLELCLRQWCRKRQPTGFREVIKACARIERTVLETDWD